ncbi:MAG: polysaccharide deacetylase family protein, partial [Actinomycetia bacterium]|nr:polysaccharide deacetylase family protein [Actinomycetes bacterium]
MSRHRPTRQTATRPGGARSAVRPYIAWGAILAVLAMFCCMIVVDGFVSAAAGHDERGPSNPGSIDRVPEEVRTGGPIIDVRDGVSTRRTAPATVVLTFDDGPDPTWTPRVLEVLNRHGVPATFFVVGSMVARHPDIARDIRASGSEIGVHTFSHAELARLTPEEVEREMSLTQFALAGATGETSYLMRPPYSSTNAAVRNAQFDVFKHLGRLGYVVALSDIDSQDWRREGVEAIVRAATPQPGEGGVVLLHDAGGDRAQTVAALDSLIPFLKAKGYRFATLTDATGLPPAGIPAQSRDAALGDVMVATVVVATTTVALLKWLLLLAGSLVILRLVLTTTLAIWAAQRRSPRRWSWGGAVTQPVSVVVPAYNEKECIAATVRSLVASDHPVEVIVVD